MQEYEKKLALNNSKNAIMKFHERICCLDQILDKYIILELKTIRDEYQALHDTFEEILNK